MEKKIMTSLRPFSKFPFITSAIKKKKMGRWYLLLLSLLGLLGLLGLPGLGEGCYYDAFGRQPTRVGFVSAHPDLLLAPFLRRLLPGSSSRLVR